MRDDRIDILRFLGLMMIIFAHVGPPKILFQLRNFDVPLMVLVSGMSFGFSYTVSTPYLGYIWKRIKRLVFPVWTFLTIYYVAQLVLYPDSSDLNTKTIFGSYTLMWGFGYVWIIRVFLLVALVSPLIFIFNKNTTSHNKYFLFLFTSFLFYELLRYISLPYIQGGIGKYISLITHYIIPYAIVFAVGLRLPSLNKKQLHHFLFISLGIFILIGFGLFFTYEKILPTQALKYPPSIYYFSYALFVSCLLWLYSASLNLFIEKLKIKNFVLFIAQNSIWIYLWHIPLVKVLHINFAMKYIVVLIISVFIVYLQVWIVNNFLINRIASDNLRKNIKALLTG